MEKDLTNSKIDRQNILNNSYAIEKLQRNIGLKGVDFKGSIRFTIKQISSFFNVNQKTIERYLEEFRDELYGNGYEVISGSRLKEFKNIVSSSVTDINVGDTTQKLGIFNYRSLLNLAMLLRESEQAHLLRNFILDITIDIINEKAGGGTKYINKRDRNFIESYFIEANYHKNFTDALRDTNKIYILIFQEKASEYRKILKMKNNENVRGTFYSEILDLISTLENAITIQMKNSYESKKRRLYQTELEDIFKNCENKCKVYLQPLIDKARSKMVSRDYTFRDALHERLREYLTPLTQEEFEKFIGKDSIDFEKQLRETEDVFKRLKER